VVDTQYVEALGDMKAFADGRVQIFFCDRTLLYMDPEHTVCRLLMPDGERMNVNVASPVGVEVYVQAAVEYARWAFSTPFDRYAKRRLQDAVQMKLLETQRMAAICGATAAQGRGLELRSGAACGFGGG
jgi:hypothetical protein